MAATDFGALSAARKKLWSEEVWTQGRDQSFWFANGFVGKGTKDTTAPVHLVTEMTETERGDRAVMQLILDLQNDGVAGDAELEGNEEALVNDEQEITIDQFRNGVKSKGSMSVQRTVLRFRAQAKDKLAFWLSDKIDEMAFLMMSGRAFTLKLDGSARDANSQLSNLAFASSVAAATSNRVKFFGAGTAENDVVVGDTMAWNDIVGICAFAKRKRIKHMRMNGKDHHAIVMSTEQARDLKQDSTYQTNVRTAGPRGPGNVLFKNAFAVIDGIMLYEHPKVYNTLGLTSAVDKWGAGANVDGAQALLLGAQAMGLARIGNARWAESDNQDYEVHPGGFSR